MERIEITRCNNYTLGHLILSAFRRNPFVGSRPKAKMYEGSSATENHHISVDSALGSQSPRPAAKQLVWAIHKNTKDFLNLLTALPPPPANSEKKQRKLVTDLATFNSHFCTSTFLAKKSSKAWWRIFSRRSLQARYRKNKLLIWLPATLRDQLLSRENWIEISRTCQK